ncbi:MAG: hypothetical protein KAR38_05980 [Calditrichia bacterium]|nr:hypothetical protein [Calditrichia bacterium]
MNFFNSGFFWFFEGIIFCIVIISLKTWTKEKNIFMPIWKWGLLVLWIFFLEFVIAFVGTSLGENEVTAATLGGILFGLLVVISGVALWRILGFAFKPHKNNE